MKPMKYDPSQNRFDVPAGMYEVEFVEVQEKEFQASGRYGKTGMEPKYLWKFKVLSGEQKDKVIEQVTGTALVSKSKLLGIVTMLVGRQLQQGEEIDPRGWIGRRFNLSWSVNPDSEQGRCHVSSLTPLAGAPAQAAPPPNGPPPRPVKAPTQPPLADLWWIDAYNNDKPVTWTLKALQEHLDAKNLNPDEVLICKVGTTEWVTASQAGVNQEIPF